MAAEQISKKTRAEFREFFVSTTLRQIELEFDAADIPLPDDFVYPPGGQRCGLVEGYYWSVDFTQ